MGRIKQPLIIFLGDMPKIKYIESSGNELINTEIKVSGTIRGHSIIIYSIRESSSYRMNK